MKRKHIILLHAVFWSVMLFAIALESVPSVGKISGRTIFLDNLIYAVSFISLFYIFYFFISERHLAKRKIAYLIASGLICTLVYTVPVTGVYIYFIYEKVLDLNGKEFLFEFRTYYFRLLETNFIFVMAGSLFKLALLWYENVMKQKEAEKQLVSNELALLRSQINPQFLFNTLAGIRSLIDSQPGKAIYSIETLSEIMSYMLYETSAEKVPLDDEIDYINNYLNLQKVRYNPGFISFEVTGNTSGILVPPLLFMPFIENVFTQGDSFPRTPGIEIRLDILQNVLAFEIMKYIEENTNQEISENNFNPKPIIRCLDLLFGNKYNLDIENGNNIYLIKLNIELIA